MEQENKYWILLSRYISNDLLLEETDDLLEWIGQDPLRTTLLQQVQSVWDQSIIYQKNVSHTIDTNAAWLKLKDQLGENRKPAKVVRIQQYKWMAAAACFMMLIGLSWFAYQSSDQRTLTTVTNHLSKKKQILLPDGTIIWLNKDGTIKYAKELASFKQREVILTGEAFFDVKPDVRKPFIIHAGETETQVLGTSFNVNAGERNVTVSVITGKVSFKKRDATDNLLLLPGDEGVCQQGGAVTKNEFKNTNFLFWKNQILSFENEELGLVFQELEKWYGINFKVNDRKLLNQRITTSFKSVSIHEVINILETLLDLKISSTGDTYIVVK